VTMTSHEVSPRVDQPDVDQYPGSSDMAWAERAYHYQERKRPRERRRAPRASRRRVRMLVATLTVVVTVGLVVTMRYVGSPPPSVFHEPTTAQTATEPQSATTLSPLTLLPPPLRPVPFVPSTISTPTR
jgi:hypothetical protein